MKNKLLKLLFANLLVVVGIVVASAQVTTYPYTETFDGGVAGWVTGYSLGIYPPSYYDEFEHGNVNSPGYSFYKANVTDLYFMTDMSANYGQETNAWVNSPKFDFSTLVQPELSLDIFADGNSTYAGGYIDYSTDSISWTRLGAIGNGVNWYDNEFFVIVPQSGPNWSSTNDAWVNASIPLTFLAGESDVYFKVVFRSSNQPSVGYGFGFDNFSVVETAPNDANPQVVAWNEPLDNICALSASQAISVDVKNLGSTDLVNDWYIKVDVSGAITYNGASEPVSDDITIGNTITHTLNATPDFSAAGTYNCTISISLDNWVSVHSTYTKVVVTEGIAEIVPTHLQDFSGATPEFGFENGSEASIAVSGGEVVINGPASAPQWVGGAGTVSEQNAWVDNADFTTTMYVCNIDANALGSLELLLDLYQGYEFSYDYTWFRLLVNGTAVAADNGVTNFNPDQYATPAFQTIRYNLSAYQGTDFVVEFQTSTKYDGCVVKYDNLIIREKLSHDIAVTEILAPTSGCDMLGQQVMVEIKNLGTNSASGFDVVYDYDNGSTVTTVTESFVGTLFSEQTAIHTFAAADYIGGGTFDVSIVWASDVNSANDEISGHAISDISNNLSSLYEQKFDATLNPVPNEYWDLEDVNNDGIEWFWANDNNANEVYAFDFEGATANDFLFSNCFVLTAGQDYKICFDYATHLAGADKGIKLHLATSQNSADIISTIVSETNINTGSSYVTAANVFTVPTTGVYHFVFEAIGASTQSAEYLFLDNIRIQEWIAPDLELTTLNVYGQSGCSLSDVNVEVVVTNISGSPICEGETLQMAYFVNTWAPMYEDYTLETALMPGASFTFMFTTPINMANVNTYNVSSSVTYLLEDPTKLANNMSGVETITNYGTPQNLTITGITGGYCENNANLMIHVDYDKVVGHTYTEYFTASTTEQPVDNTGGDWEYDIPSPFTGSITFTYTVIITNEGLTCQSIIDTTIEISSMPMVELGTDIISTDLTELIVNQHDINNNMGYDYTWAPNGETGVSSILPTYYGQYTVVVTDGYCSATDDIWVYQKQEISLRQGWGMWSTLIDPASFQNSDDFIQNVVTNGGVSVADVIIMKDDNGNVWWPAFSYAQIPAMTIGAGYQYKLLNADVVEIVGMPVVPEMNPIALNNGYSIVGFLRQQPTSVAGELASLTANNNVIIFKDQDGKVFWPDFNIDMIGNLTPGEAYKIKVNAAGLSITYSANGPANTAKSDINLVPQNYTSVLNSNNNMTLGIPTYAWTNMPSIGDEIGVFNSNGQLVGSTVFEGNNTAVVITGDDELTSDVEGLTVGEAFVIQVWNQTTGEESTCDVTAWETGSDSYAVDGISVVKNLTLSTNNVEMDNFVVFQNTPNPFSTTTQIRFYVPETSNVNITLYNVLGEAVQEITNGSHGAGYHTVEMNAGELASGTYFYKFVSDNYAETKYMSIEK